jgi:F-type H+-transporting ATPase subunit b
MLSTPEFWVAASFVIFVLLAGRKAWAAITGMLDARGARIARELDEAKRLRAEAEAMMATARRERESASVESAQMLERARADAARLAESAAAEAQASAARRERMAMDRIAAAEAGAVAEVRQAAANIATAAAREVIAGTHTAEADAALVDDAIQGLPSALRAA